MRNVARGRRPCDHGWSRRTSVKCETKREKSLFSSTHTHDAWHDAPISLYLSTRVIRCTRLTRSHASRHSPPLTHAHRRPLCRRPLLYATSAATAPALGGGVARSHYSPSTPSPSSPRAASVADSRPRGASHTPHTQAAGPAQHGGGTAEAGRGASRSSHTAAPSASPPQRAAAKLPSCRPPRRHAVSRPLRLLSALSSSPPGALPPERHRLLRSAARAARCAPPLEARRRGRGGCGRGLRRRAPRAPPPPAPNQISRRWPPPQSRSAPRRAAGSLACRRPCT